MDSRSELVRNIYNDFFSRGRRTKVTFTEPYKGGPTPLWKNIGKDNFKNLLGVSFILLLATGFEFIYMEAF